MGVFREVTVTWDGEDYTFVPSMRLLMQLEHAGISVDSVAMHAQEGRVMKATMATALAIVLQSAGAPADEEQLLQVIEHDPQEGLQLFIAVRDALYTAPPEVKKKPGKPKKK